MNKIAILGLFLLLAVGCQKDERSNPNTSLNVINAGINLPSVKINYFGSNINWSTYNGADAAVSFATSKRYSIFDIKSPHPFQIVATSDTSKQIFNGDLDLTPGKIYSLYVVGETYPYETILNTEEPYPYNFPDSAVAIRFINLSPNSPPVNINLASTPTINEANRLAYKGHTDFKKFALKKINPAGSMSFEVRDASTNILLTSYTIPNTAVSPYTTVTTSTVRFRSVTLAIKGLVANSAGTNAYSIFPIPHY